MAKFRKKPVVIDAIQFVGVFDQIDTWLDGMGYQEDEDPSMWPNEDGSITICTLEGEMKCSPGDWIIRGVAGEFYPCKPQIFAATYDPVVS
ncbi:MAG TPA: hypothetical protein VFX97_16720 [Pyrinomonadaceae bacterium]|nr:hypothetical protein [Pyrinomonadaceae bacterium]